MKRSLLVFHLFLDRHLLKMQSHGFYMNRTDKKQAKDNKSSTNRKGSGMSAKLQNTKQKMQTFGKETELQVSEMQVQTSECIDEFVYWHFYLHTSQRICIRSFQIQIQIHKQEPNDQLFSCMHKPTILWQSYANSSRIWLSCTRN